ncbi:MAG: large ribosomal subunit protein bL35 [Nocardioidaceae bacterium]
MPKMKTHSGAKDRIKTTGSGKLRRLSARRKAGAAFASTPMRGRKDRRKHAGTRDVSTADAKRIRGLLGK